MIKLYVDDLRPAPYGWVLARTITEAIRLLATQRVVGASVDHDIECNCGLGIKCECDYTETFEPVVRYIASMSKEIRPKMVCHSGNPFAYDKYTNILGDVGEKLTPPEFWDEEC